MNEEETRRSFELERYFVVRPAMSGTGGELPSYEGDRPVPVDRAYNSANVPVLSQPELTAFLYANELLGERSNGLNEAD